MKKKILILLNYWIKKNHQSINIIIMFKLKHEIYKIWKIKKINNLNNLIKLKNFYKIMIRITTQIKNLNNMTKLKNCYKIMINLKLIRYNKIMK